MADEDRLADFISEYRPDLEDDEDEVQEAMMTKFVLVTEWTRADGARILDMKSGNGAGENIPTWELNGLLHEALYGDWSD
jgi:hypothetical protein